MCRLDHQAREVQIQQIESLNTELSMPYHCIDCGWRGNKNQLGGWLGFLGAKEFCPKCGHSEFLVSGEELDEMNREDEACKLPHPLSCPTNN